MSNARLEKATELIVEAQRAIAECPPEYKSGEALIILGQVIEELKEAQADIRLLTSQRWELISVKWYKELPPKFFHRWDDAFAASVLQMSLLFTEFTVRMTRAAPDGESLEWTVSAGSQATLVVSKK